MNPTKWPWKFFDDVIRHLESQEDKYGDFQERFKEIASKWSSLLDSELTIQQVIVMLLEAQFVILKNNPSSSDILKEMTSLIAYLSEINARNRNSSYLSHMKQLSCSKKSLINVESI